MIRVRMNRSVQQFFFIILFLGGSMQLTTRLNGASVDDHGLVQLKKGFEDLQLALTKFQEALQHLLLDEKAVKAAFETFEQNLQQNITDVFGAPSSNAKNTVINIISTKKGSELTDRIKESFKNEYLSAEQKKEVIEALVNNCKNGSGILSEKVQEILENLGNPRGKDLSIKNEKLKILELQKAHQGPTDEIEKKIKDLKSEIEKIEKDIPEEITKLTGELEKYAKKNDSDHDVTAKNTLAHDYPHLVKIIGLAAKNDKQAFLKELEGFISAIGFEVIYEKINERVDALKKEVETKKAGLKELETKIKETPIEIQNLEHDFEEYKERLGSGGSKLIYKDLENKLIELPERLLKEEISSKKLYEVFGLKQLDQGIQGGSKKNILLQPLESLIPKALKSNLDERAACKKKIGELKGNEETLKNVETKFKQCINRIRLECHKKEEASLSDDLKRDIAECITSIPDGQLEGDDATLLAKYKEIAQKIIDGLTIKPTTNTTNTTNTTINSGPKPNASLTNQQIYDAGKEKYSESFNYDNLGSNEQTEYKKYLNAKKELGKINSDIALTDEENDILENW